MCTQYGKNDNLVALETIVLYNTLGRVDEMKKHVGAEWCKKFEIVMFVFNCCFISSS